EIPFVNLICYTIEFINRRMRLRQFLYMNDVTRENVHVNEANSLHLEAAGVTKTIHHNAKIPVRHGYYLEYQSLQRICIAILRAEYHYFTRDSNNEVYGVLFDGAWMFEEYINTLIGS